MTNMQATESKSHSVVNDIYAFGQWQKCRHVHNPVPLGNRSMTNMHLVNDKYAGTESKSHSVVNDIYASGQWQKCRQLSLNIILWSMTFMRAHLSLTGVNDTYACISVIDRGQWQSCMHKCHWPWSMTKMRTYLSLTSVNDEYACINVIDWWSMTIMRAYLSLTCVIDWVYTMIG